MNEITLSQYVQEHGQSTTARALNVTQGAVWQMLESERSIFITTKEDGSIEAYERKPIGKQKSAA